MLALALIGATACSTSPQASPSTTRAPTSTPATSLPPVQSMEQAWGTTGDPNPFRTPDGLALDSQGNLYVTDSGNHRIQKLDGNGQFLAMWGTRGSGDGQLSCTRICMVAVDPQDRILVTDNDNDRVQVFDTDGTFLAKWGSPGTGDGQFDGPFGIAVDRDGKVYVGDVGNARIQVFDSDGTFLAKWGSRGTGDGQFSSDLADIAVDAVGNVYVTDRSNGIAKFDGSGALLATLDACGDNRPVSSATGIAIDLEGRVHAFDLWSKHVCTYDADGRFLFAWNGADSVDGRLSAVGGIAVDAQGTVYVAELFVNRVRAFRPT